MEDNEEPKPENPTQPEPHSQPTGARPQIPSEPRPEFINPQTEGIDRVPEVKKEEK